MNDKRFETEILPAPPPINIYVNDIKSGIYTRLKSNNNDNSNGNSNSRRKTNSVNFT